MLVNEDGIPVRINYHEAGGSRRTLICLACKPHRSTSAWFILPPALGAQQYHFILDQLCMPLKRRREDSVRKLLTLVKFIK